MVLAKGEYKIYEYRKMYMSMNNILYIYLILTVNT